MMKYMLLLEPLRGLAAVWVFLYHFHFSESWRLTFPSLLTICRHGDLGVPMFFVISGFCIAAAANNTVRKAQPTSQFLNRRLRRIFPCYWCSIAVVIVLPFIIEFISSLKTGHYLAPSSNNHVYGFLCYNWIDWLKVISLAQIFQPVPEALVLSEKFDTINSVYWTLALEVQFYLIVTLAVLLRPYTNALLAFVTLLSIPFAIDESTYISGICLPYWPMFAIGVLVFQLFERGYLPSRLMGQRAPWISGVLIGASGIAFLPFVLDSRPINMLAFALFVGGILFAAEGLDASFQRLLFVRRSIPAVLIRLLIILGTISYSIYLLHAKLQFFSSQFIRQIFPHDSIAHDLSTIGFTLILCYPFYLLCEKPFIGAREVAKVKPDTLSKELTMPQV